MSVDLRDLYQEIILDHSRNPRNSGELEDATGTAQGNNPLCGDRVSVSIRLDGDRITDARFVARGCAISVASASMMTEMLKGKTVAEAQAAFDSFRARLEDKDTSPAGNDDADELGALMGVRDFPTRIKCATLPWHTLRAALKGAGDTQITTE